ncbi:ATP-binding protein [Spongiactinospora sp. 9N601]|uniref:ATP-binding protein n=1 Tax=Spongiactinospora sp. 9N601 TaxID=3375149 RepID=UPI0037A9DCD3
MSTRAVSPKFVGRSGELASLARALGLAREGSASTVLVGGEAGVGKTRLIREFTARAGGDARVLAGGCLELGHDGLPFAPFAAVLRTLTRDLGHEAIAALLPGGSASAAMLLVPADPPTELRGQLMENLSRMMHEPSDWAEKEAQALEAIEVAHLVGDAATEAEAMTTVAWVRCRDHDLARHRGGAGQSYR